MILSRFSLLPLLFFAFSLLVSAQTAAPTPPQNDDPVKITTEEIKLNVSAFNRAGKFVDDVKKEDLVIIEDNILHQADSIRRIPANVLIVLDTGGEMRQAKNIDQTRKAAQGLISALQPEDSVAILHYHDQAEVIAEWTNNKSLLLDILDKKLNFGKRSVFVDALQLATQFLQKTPLDNRHLVLITDGTDSRNKKNERDAAMNRLLATSISVHVISYTQLEREKIEPKTKMFSKTPPPKAMPDEVAATLPNGVRDRATAPKIGPTINLDRALLRKMRERKEALLESEKYLYNLAESTGGEFVLPETKEEMLEKTAQVAQLIDSHYVITYTPKRPLSEAAKGEVRNIQVTSKRQGLQIMARRKLVIEE